MKQWVNKIRTLLFNTRGETLMEGIASMLVFVVLVMSVTMMIMTSLRITHNASVTAQERQDEAADVIINFIPGVPDEIPLVISNASDSISISVYININSNLSFVAYEPTDSPP